jgi:pyridinium-3,5-bisthiocarboxylic acid mononucleotide nickel chelatase
MFPKRWPFFDFAFLISRAPLQSKPKEGACVRVAHFDCFSGISGDMTVAALLDAGVPFEPIRSGVESLGLPVQVAAEKVRKGGMAATYFRVDAPVEDEHRFLPDVEAILARAALTQRQRSLALKIFGRLAQAEAAVHGMPIDKVHFHEVGALDSLADITAAAIGLDLLGVERFTSGPVAVGSGMVKCAHGLMPVPAPATAELLKGVPLRPAVVQAELTTPTGAAILTTVVNAWVEQPALTLECIGHGAGKKNFPEQPNLLRLLVGQSSGGGSGLECDQVWMLETNLDDLPAEVVGYCLDRLLASGALDVFCTPITMKKNRPAVMLSVMAPPDRVDALEAILFAETTTLGVRRYLAQRHKLHRQACTVETPLGQVQGKLGWRDGQPPAFAPEYEDCARLARARGVPLREVFALAQLAYAAHGTQKHSAGSSKE